MPSRPRPHSALLTLLLLAASLCRLEAVAPAVVAGEHFTLFLKADGTVLAAGANEYGQLGDGTTTGHGAPREVAGLGGGVLAVAAGSGHSLFLKTDGTVWASGRNDFGQLGDGTGISRSVVWPVPDLKEVRAVAAGDQHSLFLKADGTVWAAGINDAGQLGDGTTSTRLTPVMVQEGVRAIAAGPKGSFFLKTNGTVRAAGENTGGQLGVGNFKNQPVPVAVKGSPPLRDLTGVESVSAGRRHTLFLTADGTLLACGANNFGAFGDGTTDNRLSAGVTRTGVRAMAAGDGCSFFVGTDGVLTAAGNNSSGQLGDGTMTHRPQPVTLMTGVESVAAGLHHTCFLKTGGAVLGAGDNYRGALGNGRMGYTPTPVTVPGLATGVRAVSAGQWHSLFLKTDGTVMGTGSNWGGELADGTAVSRHSPGPCAISGVTGISAGVFVSVFIKSDGSVHFTGQNLFGRAGGSRHLPTALPAAGPCWMAGSSEHVLLLQGTGTVVGAGNNFMGQVGNGTDEDPRTLVPVAHVADAVSVAVGWDHSLFLRRDGTVMACGRNSDGQLGGLYPSDWDGWTHSRLSPLPVAGLSGITAVAAGGWHSFFLKADGTVLGAGFNGTGQLGDGTSDDRFQPVPVPGLRDVKAVAAGNDHSLFLKQDGTVWAVGGNFSGQLGDGTTNTRLRPVPVPGLRDIAAVEAGDGVSFFVSRDGALLVSGTNSNGVAGLGPYLQPVPVETLQLGRDQEREASEVWRREQFGEQATDPAVSGWLADPDGDGVVNLLERAFNLPALRAGRPVLNPEAEQGQGEAARAGLPWVTLVPKPQGPVLAVHYVRLKAAGTPPPPPSSSSSSGAGLVYTPEFCSAPGGGGEGEGEGGGGDHDGGWTAATGPERVVPIDDRWERVTVEDTGGGGGGARFARVRVGF